MLKKVSMVTPSPWGIYYTRDARKDAKKIAKAGLRKTTEALLDILRRNPFQPPYEKLVGDLAGVYSRRINIKHRLLYQVYKQRHAVKVLRMWTHYQ